MIFGAELPEFFLFGKQLGLALAGAASLWGFVFLVRTWEKKECLLYEWVARKLILLFSVGLGIASLSWISLLLLMPAWAHEGIVLAPTKEGVSSALEALTPVFFVWILASAAFLAFWRVLSQKLALFYLFQILIILLLMGFPEWTGGFGRHQAFFFGHSIHSIFTLGTVIVLDFLFLLSRSSSLLRSHVFPLFPLISKAIWIGLGFDFLSVALVFEEAIHLTPKFFFMQTVIGILIVNGVLLSGPIARKLSQPDSQAWVRAGEITGVVSLASWTSITFVDSFSSLTLSYPQLLTGYLLFASCLFLGHKVMDSITRKSEFSSLPIHG